MSNEEKAEVKSTIRKEFYIPIAGFVLALIGFYYNTNNSLAEHKEELSTLKVEIKSKASTDDFKALKEDIHDLQTSF